MSIFISLWLTLRDDARSRAGLQLEILALRHQLHVRERSRARRLRLTRVDRLLWVWFSRVWCHWRTTQDAPFSRPVAPLTAGRVIARPQVGGLHHRYERAA
jgi:hypothetical protein